MGGILVLEARDMNHAIELMSRHPDVKVGPFEIRPADDLSGMVAQSVQRRGVHRSEAPRYKIATSGGDRPKFTPCLWFDDKAEEAARFYTAVFHNSGITGITRYSAASAEAANQPEGTVMTVAFEIEGHPFEVNLSG